MKIIYIVIILIFSGYNIAFANKIFQGALTFYEQKKYDEAIILFERAQKTEKLNNNELAELLYKLSKSYTYKKKYDAAIENLKILIEKISDNKYYIENSVYLLANLYNIKGDTVRANALKNYLFKNFPQSIYTQEKYWLLDSSNNISTTDGQITAQQKITQPQQISKPTDIPIKSDISADAVKIIPEIESELIPIKTNVEYIILDFDKSTLKSMIEHFSSITKIQYIIDFYNFNDYITVKSESRINVKFLPVFLNKILEEYKYAIKDFGNGYKINKTVIFAETYIPIHKFYFIMQIDNEILRKIQLSLDDLKYPNIKYFVYKEFNYFIIQAEDSETLTKFLDALKISTEKIDRYITKTFKTNKVKSTEIVNYLKTIMLSKLSAAELFKKQQITTRKDLYVQNILTTEENVNVIRAIKDIKDDPSENIITISFLKEHEKKITEIIEKLDVDTLVNEGIYKVYTLKNAAADDVVKVLSDLFKEEIKMVRDDERNLVISEKLIKHITADKRTNSVILNADASVLSEIEVIINYLDNNVNIRIFPPRQIKVYKIKNHKAIDIKRHLDLFNTNQNALKIYSSVADERTNILIIVANIEDFNSIDLIINELDKNIESLAQRKMISKIYETRNRTPDYIIANLEKIITEGLYKNAINFIKMFAIEKQNKFVVLTDNPDILQTIQEWLEKLDNPEVSMQLIDRKELKTFVYYCKNTPAEDLANMLNTMI
ncbi:MAG TPA: secretin N-terminal domain-containing protein, partial [bacterium]|nr:secretin N-terminal domain-containing protein [bacterium]